MCVFTVGKLVIFYIALISIRDVEGRVNWMETEHYPHPIQLSHWVNGTKLPDRFNESPDFRLEEDEWTPSKNEKMWRQENRPFRISPFWKQYKRWGRAWTHREETRYLGCYCTTVYKRLTVLAGCAVITAHHILTTATSTELVLQHHRTDKQIGDVLGAWFDHDKDCFNSSMYMEPIRIHYHPRYLWPHLVNVTHPLPFSYDLAVWTAKNKFPGDYLLHTVHTVLCQRGGPHWYQYLSSTPRWRDLAHVIGFQFVKATKKNPMPWFRYLVRTRDLLSICPKTEWNWYHCLYGNIWSKYGLESGAAWHRQLENRYWLFNGLIGMCAFTMHLRSTQPTHYFTVVNSHPVLDFLYDSFMGRLPYQYLDDRYYDSKWGHPRQKAGDWSNWFHNLYHNSYQFGHQYYDKKNLPWY